MEGLAASMAQPQGQTMSNSGMPQGMPTVEEVIALLMEGADPAELEAAGIPSELIMQAIQVIEQELAKQGQAPQQPTGQPAGLAQQMATQ